LVTVAAIALTLSITATADAAVWSQARTAKAFMAAITPEFSTSVPSLAAVEQAATGLRNLEPHTTGPLHALIVKAAKTSALAAKAYSSGASAKTLNAVGYNQGKAVALAAVRLGVFPRVEALQKAAGAS
jgi:hypothetical protein